MTARLTLEEVKSHLGNEVASVLGVSPVHLALEAIGTFSRDDNPAAYRVGRRDGAPLAVLLCSARNYPDMVQRGMRRAADARGILAAQQARAILVPLLEGRVDNCTFALLRHCSPLSTRRPLRWVQRAVLAPRLLEWLFQVCRTTVSAVDDSLLETSFGAPLASLRAIERLKPTVHEAADLALRRLHDGSWKPMHVLMHGDFWWGNVLIDQPLDRHPRAAWADRFVVIDWAGAELKGYAFFDLVRLSLSVGLTPRALGAQLVRYRHALGIDSTDAMGSLLCALGHIAIHLECFPMERYVSMVHACHDAMSSAAHD